MLADRPDIALIEDNAHGAVRHAGADQPLGSFGRFAALSFHETKNFICGEGGALLLNDAADVDRARVLYDKGTNRRAFLLGQVDKYSWKDTGSSFGLSDVLAAYLLAQLEQRDVIQAKRRAVFERYHRAAGAARRRAGLRCCRRCRPTASRRTTCSTCCCRTASSRNACSARCGTRASTRPSTTCRCTPRTRGRTFAARATECPVTDDISGRLLRLPFHNNLTAADVDRVVAAFVSSVTESVSV